MVCTRPNCVLAHVLRCLRHDGCIARALQRPSLIWRSNPRKDERGVRSFLDLRENIFFLPNAMGGGASPGRSRFFFSGKPVIPLRLCMNFYYFLFRSFGTLSDCTLMVGLLQFLLCYWGCKLVCLSVLMNLSMCVIMLHFTSAGWAVVP